MRVGDLLERRFRLDQKVGSGAMGTVFRARDLARNVDVAVKVMRRPDAVEEASRFEREAEILLALQHPSVVRYVAHGRTPTLEPFLAMEWLSGETLKTRLDRAPLALPETIDVGLALASALAGAHARGVVHRDLKPANVFLVGSTTDQVRLIDFGVARVRGRALTEAGTAIGTPAYMSPEQATGEGDVGAPSDVFSLGTLLFELLAGARPFEADEMLDMLLKLTVETAPSLALHAPFTPRPLVALVDQMLAKTPGARPAMSEVFERLGALRGAGAPRTPGRDLAAVGAHETIVEGGPVARAVTLARATPAARPPRRAWIVVATAFAAAAGVAVAVIVLLARSSGATTGSPRPRAAASLAPTAVASATDSPVPSSGFQISLSGSGISFSLTFGPPACSGSAPCRPQSTPPGAPGRVRAP